jgi:dihydroorotate dehydrogenase
MLSYILWKLVSVLASLNFVHAKIFYLKTLAFLDKLGLLKRFFGVPVVKPVKVMNMHFANPLGLGAGFDVNGDFVNTLAKLGFGFLEFGTVTPHAQLGNQSAIKMKLYHNEKSVISCDFDQNMGIDYLVHNLENCAYKGIIGIQINKNNITPDANMIDDLQYCMRRVIKVANYVAIQVPETIVSDHSMLEEFFSRLKATQEHLRSLYELYLSRH